MGRVLLALVCVVLLAGCGDAKQACTSPKERQAMARLEVDLTAIEHAAALPAPDTLKGNASINRATDRFLLQVETAPIDNLKRNRMIDHAAALLHGSCEQCFQALEAERPIVNIAHGDVGCPAAYDGRQRIARALMRESTDVHAVWRGRSDGCVVTRIPHTAEVAKRSCFAGGITVL